MTVKKIVLLSLTGVLLFIYILQLCFTNKAQIKSIKPKEEIATLEIINQKEKFSLEKKDHDFFVDSIYSANKDMAEYVFSTFEKINIIDAISKKGSKDELLKYGLINPIIVNGRTKNNKVIQKIKIGKTTTNGNQTYIQLNDQSEIFLASGNLFLAFNFSANDFYDYTLYSIKTDDVYKIEFFNFNNECKLSLEKTGEAASVKWALNGKEANFDSVQNWISSITNLSATEWIEDFESFDTTQNPDWTILMGVAGKNIQLKFFDFDNTEKVICLCNVNSFPCYVKKSDVEKYFSFLKS